MSKFDPSVTPDDIALTPEQIINAADSWQRGYGFFARNAHWYACKQIHELGLDELMPNSIEIDQELERRGVPQIENKEQYDALVAEHGLPPAMRKKNGN